MSKRDQYVQDRDNQDQYPIDLSINCPKRHSEAIIEDIPTTVCLVEELLAQALTTFFDVVLIDDVSVRFTPGREVPITIGLHAQGIELLRNIKNLDSVIEDKLICALTEIF